MAFFVSDDYTRKSAEAQKRVQAAIDCLVLRVQVDTRIAVEELQKRCKMLPNMDKKLDSILALTHENSDKLDQMLKHSGKQSAKEERQERKESNMEDFNIPIHQMSVVCTRFICTHTIYNYSYQRVFVRVRTRMCVRARARVLVRVHVHVRVRVRVRVRESHKCLSHICMHKSFVCVSIFIGKAVF